MSGGYQPASGWKLDTRAGQALLEPDDLVGQSIVDDLKAELVANQSFLEAVDGGTGDRVQSSGLAQYASSLGEAEQVQFPVNVHGVLGSLLNELHEDGRSDVELIDLLRDVLKALDFLHQEFDKSGSERGHGNVCHELIFRTDGRTIQQSFALGPFLDRPSAPFQTELRPSNAFSNQVPSRWGDLYALGMIALRFKLGNKGFEAHPAFASIFELTEIEDRAISWQAWHDGREVAPNLHDDVEDQPKTHPALAGFVDRLLEKNIAGRFTSALEAVEELKNVELQIGVAPVAPDMSPDSSNSSDNGHEKTEQSIGGWPPNGVQTGENEGLMAKVRAAMNNTTMVVVVLGLLALAIAFIIWLLVFRPGGGVIGPEDPGERYQVTAFDLDLVREYGDEAYACQFIAESYVDVDACRQAEFLDRREPMIRSEAASLFELQEVREITGGVTSEPRNTTIEPVEIALNDGAVVRFTRNGKFEVLTDGMVTSPSSQETVVQYEYLIRYQTAEGRGKVNLTVRPPNARPQVNDVGRIVDIPVNEAEGYTIDLLTGVTDADLLERPATWTMDEALRIGRVNGSPLAQGETTEIPFPEAGADAKVIIDASGTAVLEGVSTDLESGAKTEFEYQVVDVLNQASERIDVTVRVTTPSFIPSPPVAMPDELEIDLSTYEGSALFNLLTGEGGGQADLDTDIGNPNAPASYVEVLTVSQFDARPLVDGRGVIDDGSGAVLTLLVDGTLEVEGQPAGLSGTDRTRIETSYTISDVAENEASTDLVVTFFFSEDPDYVRLSRDWRVRIAGQPNRRTEGEIDLRRNQLPRHSDCDRFAENMTDETWQRLFRSPLDVLNDYWVESFDRTKAVICRVQTEDGGQTFTGGIIEQPGSNTNVGILLEPTVTQ